MKIAYVIDHLRADGTQTVLKQLVESLSRRGHSQLIFCLNNSVDRLLVASLCASGAELHIIGQSSLLSGYGLLKIRNLLRREACDVVVTFLFYSDVFGRLSARIAGVPRIVTSLRARNIHYSGWQRALVRRTMRWVDTIIINSADICDFAVAEEGAPPERIVTIPNGVCIDLYLSPVTGAMLRAEFGLEPDRRMIGGVGRLTHQKGFDLLINALAQLPESDVDLLLVGVGEEKDRLRTQAEALGVARRVHFAGYRRDLPQLLGALDLFVHPARFEGMPNALLEAMAAGCPIVASMVDGNRELIEDGAHGWLTPAEDVGALASAISAALSDSDEAKRRGAAARRRAAEHFSVEAMVDRWESVLASSSEALQKKLFQ